MVKRRLKDMLRPHAAAFVLFGAAAAALFIYRAGAQAPAFSYRKVMVPVRDGVRLETVILAPTTSGGALPILFRRTPYGVPASADGMPLDNLRPLVKDGYISLFRICAGGSAPRERSSSRRRSTSRIPRPPAKPPTHTTQSNGSSRTCRTTTGRSGCSACRTTGSPQR